MSHKIPLKQGWAIFYEWVFKITPVVIESGNDMMTSLGGERNSEIWMTFFIILEAMLLN